MAPEDKLREFRESYLEKKQEEPVKRQEVKEEPCINNYKSLYKTNYIETFFVVLLIIYLFWYWQTKDKGSVNHD